MAAGRNRRPKRRGVWLRLDATLAVVAGGGAAMQALIGVPLVQLLGKRFPGTIPFVEGESIVEVLRGVFEGSAGAVVVAELRRGGRPRWLELDVESSAAFAEQPNDHDDGGGAERLLSLRFEDVTARVGEEMRLRTALAEERDLAELAAELGRWSDAGLEEGIALALDRIARQQGALRAAIVPDTPLEAGAEAGVGAESSLATLRRRTPIPGTGVRTALEIVWPEPPAATEVATRLIARQAELLGAALAREAQGRVVRQTETRFRALADHSRDGICEVAGDARILYASPSFLALCGTAVRDLVGSDFLDLVEPEDRRRVAALIRPGAYPRRRTALVYRLRTSDGLALSVESTARAYTGPDGGERVVVTTRDVSERERARLALERQIELETRVAELSRHFIDLDVDATNEGIASQLVIVARLAEAQHSWFYSFPTGRGGPEHFDWWQERDPTRLPLPLDQTVARFPYSTQRIRSGQIYHVPRIDGLPPEAANEREDLTRRGVKSLLGIPIMSGEQFVGFLGFESYAREVAWSEETIMLLRLVGEIFYSCLRRRRIAEELRDSQSQLLQAQKMEAVGTLAGGIAHDFNNHLAVMLGNARFLKQEVAADADVLAAIEDLERSADHCAKLTRSLLAFSRRSPVEVVPVAVADVMRGVVSLVRPLLPATFRLEASLSEERWGELGEFAVDPVQIQQVLVNLLVNARDAMAQGGTIRMGAERRRALAAEASLEGLEADREYIVLSVADSGCGMDAETKRRVFEPFFTTKPVGQGTGLGLAMAYGIVRQSGGAISIETRVGEGSTFRVFLPARTVGRAGTANAVDAQTSASARAVRGLAVVHEPDAQVRERVCESLRALAFDVEVARAPEAIAERVRRASSSVALIVAALPRRDASLERFAEVVRGGLTGPPVAVLVDADPTGPLSSEARIQAFARAAEAERLEALLGAWLSVLERG